LLIYFTYFIVTVTVVSLLIVMLLIFLICATFVQPSRLASAENDDKDTDQSIGKMKLNIEQNEKCKDSSVCRQSAENNLILCPRGSTCVFMTNDFVPYNLALPK
jgi:hypothetical protein